MALTPIFKKKMRQIKYHAHVIYNHALIVKEIGDLFFFFFFFFFCFSGGFFIVFFFFVFQHGNKFMCQFTWAYVTHIILSAVLGKLLRFKAAT